MPPSPCEPEPASLTGTAVEDPTLAGDLVAKTNAYRVSRELPPLASDDRLLTAARQHAKFVLLSRWWTTHGGYLIHCDSVGHDQLDRAVAAGYPLVYVGENVAWGTVGRSADQVFSDILVYGEDPANRRFRSMGLACYTRADSAEYACVQVLAE